MARKRRSEPQGRPGSRPAALQAIAVPAATVTEAPAAPIAVPREAAQDGWASGVLALTIFLAPALGVPGEEMLQDTLKSFIVSFGALFAAFLFLLAQRRRREPLRWHALLWLPLMLMAYALGSMAWSHTYLAGVEAIRWFIFSLIAWLVLNTFTRDRLPTLAAGVHAGALAASLWAMAQFWFELALFPQGPNPASTFINRNFFAEFAICALPFGALLLARQKERRRVLALAFSNALVLTAILMTGTRSALMALWLQLFLVLPLIVWRCRAQLACSAWPRRLQWLAPGVLAATVLVLGLLPSGNASILQEGLGATPLARALHRTESIGPKDYSLGLRLIMWRATVRAIEDKPLTGLGAGAWESEIPRYQPEGSQLETDYYVHNEFLQLVAEYGVVGWIFLLLLVAYCLAAAWRSWVAQGPEADAERPWRAAILCSLLALMIVSNIGFPWRLAATGALFALCLGALAASDARLAAARRTLATPLRWSPAIGHGALVATLGCMVLGGFITQRAAECERKLVTAARLAIGITQSGDWNNPAYGPAKRQLLQLVEEGVAINPHYRKITPLVADELARWGDWADATWIWESVLSSRPYVVAIICNVARGYSTLGQNQKALAYLERAKRIQPNAPTVRSLEVVLLARMGQERRAMELARTAMAQDLTDYDLINTYFLLAWRAHDFPLAQQLLAERIRRWPNTRAQGRIQLGTMLARDLKDPAQALPLFRQGLAEAAPGERAGLLQQIPEDYRAQAAASTPQTSARSK